MAPECLSHAVDGKMEAATKTGIEIADQPDVYSNTSPECSCRSTSVLLRTNIHLAIICWTAVLAGWNDASNGPLLPRMQQVYHVDYAAVSLLFVISTLGYITGSISNMFLTDRIDFGNLLTIGSACQIVAYCIEAAAVPFPAFLFAHAINGFGMAVQAAQNFSYVVRFKDNPGLRMGLVMAAYGLGALLSPMSATYFAQVPHWSYHYLTSLGIALLNGIFQMVVFRLRHQEACLAEIGITDTKKGTNKKSPVRQILSLRDAHLLAAFMLCYVGAEVTLGGWIVTYVIKLRGGGSTSGYIVTGFWAGLTAGRVALLKVSDLIGESRAPVVYIVLATALEFVVWFVPSLYGDAVAVACIGVFLGPLYGAAFSHGGRVLPQWLLAGAFGWIGGAGQVGSALIPFITGAIAQRAGIGALPPVLIAMSAIVAALWMMIVRSRIR